MCALDVVRCSAQYGTAQTWRQSQRCCRGNSPVEPQWLSHLVSTERRWLRRWRRYKVEEAYRRCRIRRERQCSRYDSDYKRSRSEVRSCGWLDCSARTDRLEWAGAGCGSQVIHQTQAIPPIGWNGQHLVSQAQIQSQAFADSPVILDVSTEETVLDFDRIGCSIGKNKGV